MDAVLMLWCKVCKRLTQHHKYHTWYCSKCGTYKGDGPWNDTSGG